jgi:CheY-like chemotaxis protein
MRRDPNADSTSGPATALMGTLDGARVLVVDDDPDTLATLSMLLQAYGAEVAEALAATHALKELETFRPDIVVSDVSMPGEDGLALVGKIRKRGAEQGGRIPVLALSAHVSPESRQRALDAGFQSFLNKPVSGDVLLAAVRAALEAVGPVERRRNERRSFVIGAAVPERRAVYRRRDQPGV